MRKVIALLIVITGLFFINSTSVRALCTDWTCQDQQNPDGSITQNCTCNGGDSGGAQCSCGPGTYCCNASGVIWQCCSDGGTCFPAGTKVSLPGGATKNIEDVKAGDKVLSRDETGKQSISTVQNLLSPVTNNLCQVDYTNGDKLQVTKGHPLFTQNGWKAIDPEEAAKEDPGVPVSRLMIGDFMAKVNGSWPQVSSISCQNEQVQTYNLTVDNAHTYFADGFLAHNKGAVCNDCGGGSGIWLTSFTSYATSFTATWDGDWGGFNIACGGGESFMVYIGTDYNAVNSNCLRFGSGDATVGNFMYRGVGGSLPLGCLYSRQVSWTSRSFNSAASVPAITLHPGTTYYVKISPRVDKDAKIDTEPGTHFSCGGPLRPYMSACTISPSSQTMVVGPPAVQFTTSTGTPTNIERPTPVVTGWEWTPDVCTRTDPDSGDCLRMNYGYFHVKGYHFGTVAKYISDYAKIRVKQHGTNTVLYDGDAWPNDIENYNEATDYGELWFGTRYNEGPQFKNYNPGALTPDDITVYYPPPASLTVTDKVDHIEYSQLPTPPPQYISITPTTSMSAPGYATSVSGVAGTALTTLLAKVYAKNGIAPFPVTQCQAQITVSGASEDWWQVKDSDVQTNGGLSSKIPASNFFGLAGPGGYPGVPAYGSSTDLTSANVSDTTGAKWLANSMWASPKKFDYAYFANQVPEGTVINQITSSTVDINYFRTNGNPSSDGYYWFKYDGASGGTSGQDLHITGPVPGNLNLRKIILLVNSANLHLDSSLSLTDGTEFFMPIVNGNIIVDPSVTSIEGLYLADGTFTDGSTGAQNDVQLHVRGSVAAYGGVNMQRDLGANNSTTPADLFEYAPDQIMLFPPALSVRKLNWKEVAP